MKSIDFSQPGGFPLTQDQLDYLQTAYKECLNALASSYDQGPFTVVGAVVTKTSLSGTIYNYSITSGWIFYQGNIIRVIPGTLLGIDESVNGAYVQIINSATPLTYNDGSTPNVVLDATISLILQPIGTLEDATHFLLNKILHNGIMPLPVFSTISLTPDGQTITFTRPQTIHYNAFGTVGTNTITLDSTNAKEGCEVILYIIPPAGGMTIAFLATGFEDIIAMTGASSLITPSSPSHPLIIKIKIVRTNIVAWFLVEAYYNG